MDIFKYCFPGNYYFTGHVVTFKMFRLKGTPAFSPFFLRCLHLLSFSNEITELHYTYCLLLSPDTSVYIIKRC